MVGLVETMQMTADGLQLTALGEIPRLRSE
jgi:hypothetical protein